MQTEYVYIKKRSEFGKRCYFSEYDRLEVDIKSEPKAYANDYVRMDPVHRGTLCAKVIAAHEVGKTPDKSSYFKSQICIKICFSFLF